MQQGKENSFNSKILLFGEYGIIHDSMGLSIPFSSFEGKFTFEPVKLAGKNIAESNKSLKKYATYLRGLIEEAKLIFVLDIEAFEADIENGMVFDSSIPQGFGVGSSGALVAAIYDKYALEKIPNDREITANEMIKLKEHLSQMESYFHGRSSGLDPLICYLKHPILIRSKEDIDAVGMPGMDAEGKGAIFLINTGKPGETQPMVNLFLEKCKEEGFFHVMKHEIIPFNDNCIRTFLKGEVKEMFSNLKELSRLALNYLKPMIPTKFHKLWKHGIETQAYYLKLCGSGGGGYILGFTQDLDHAKSELGGQEIEVIHRF